MNEEADAAAARGRPRAGRGRGRARSQQAREQDGCPLCPHNIGGFMIQCDHCHCWFHGRCVALEERDADFIDEYYCPDCLAGDSGLRISLKDPSLVHRQHQAHAAQQRPARLIHPAVRFSPSPAVVRGGALTARLGQRERNALATLLAPLPPRATTVVPTATGTASLAQSAVMTVTAAPDTDSHCRVTAWLNDSLQMDTAGDSSPASNSDPAQEEEPMLNISRCPVPSPGRSSASEWGDKAQPVVDPPSEESGADEEDEQGLLPKTADEEYFQQDWLAPFVAAARLADPSCTWQRLVGRLNEPALRQQALLVFRLTSQQDDT